MAKNQRTAKALIRDVFSPQVGVICSPEASSICQKNNLTFVELLLPFSRLTSEVHIKDHSGVSVSLQDFHIVFKDATVLPPQQTYGLKLLSDSVNGPLPSSAHQEKIVTSKGYEIVYPASTPWYEEFRECYLAIAAPSDHEFIRHYTACVFVVSSSHTDPMAQFAQLTLNQNQQQQQTPAKLPKWFYGDLCRYYILLHDSTDSEDARAEAVYQSMKAKYGVLNCHLLKINTVTPNIDPSNSTEIFPDPWSNYIRQSSVDSVGKETSTGMNGGIVPTASGMDHPLDGSPVHHPLGSPPQSPRERHASGGRRRPRTRSISDRGCCLSTHDHDRLRHLVHEFVVRALIPWAERLIRSLYDVFQSKRKGGFLKSIFSRAKTVETKPANGYAQESSEMLLRRLADLSFMFQLYPLAYDVYHMLKKDFESDKAWLYSAGAQEMAGLSVFMQGTGASRQYPTHYMDGAISVYQSCKSQSFMSRAVMLSTEVLKEKELWLQAASQFLKLTGEEFDLRSAILLEQAAYCYINMPSPQVRKFAFYMVLAGHRYSKASQRKHSLRCYNIAQQVYEKKDWRLAEDHIGVTTARLSTQLKDHSHALSNMGKLLVESTQTPAQQSLFLQEYLDLYSTVMKQATSEKQQPEMTVPAIIHNEIIVTVEQFDMATNSSVYSNDIRWAELEEACVTQSQGSLPLVLQRSIPSFNRFMKNKAPPIGYIHETQFVRILLHNPLKVNLVITDLAVEWRFKPEGEENFTSHGVNVPEVCEQQPIAGIELAGEQKHWLVFRLIPQALGYLNLVALSYQLSYRDINGDASQSVQGRVLLHVRGQRLNDTKHEMGSVVYATDKRLIIHVTQAMPKTKVVFQSFPSSLRCGQLQKVPVSITNVGPAALRNLHLACNDPTLICIPEFSEQQKKAVNSKSAVRKVQQLGSQDTVLNGSETLNFDLWVKGSDIPTTQPINFLVYYESTEDPGEKKKIRHRCSRFSFLVTSSQVLRSTCSVFQRTAQDSHDLGSYLISVLVDNCSPVYRLRPTDPHSLPSNYFALEFAIVDLLCQSERLTIQPLASQLPLNTKVNQSEVALLNASLRYETANDSTPMMSKIHLNSEEVCILFDEAEVNPKVIEIFLKNILYPEISADEDDEDYIKPKPIDAVLGIVWKGFTMNNDGTTSQNMGMLSLPINIIEDSSQKVRSASINGQQAVVQLTRASIHNKSTQQEATTDHVEYHLKHEPRLTVNLEKTRLCAVPVTLTIKSYCLENMAFTITPSGDDSGFIWSGKTKTELNLKPNEEVNVKLLATVLNYGVFNLDSLEIKEQTGKVVRISSHSPHQLIVEKAM